MRGILCGIALIALAVVPESARASEADELDAELNQTYQRVIGQLPSEGREALRKAQRAWLVFAKLNDSTIELVARRPGQSPAEAERLQLGSVRLRIDELRTMLDGNRVSVAGSSQLKQEDEHLNSVYQEILSRLTTEEVAKLREAQRAWVVFRQASQSFGPDACAMITKDRAVQLSNLAETNTGTPETEKTEPETTPDPNVPDPFESTRHPPGGTPAKP